jgi:hypothetical protein
MHLSLSLGRDSGRKRARSRVLPRRDLHAYEQMDVGARWFDDLLLNEATKSTVGRENANRLLSLGLPPLSVSGSLTSAS